MVCKNCHNENIDGVKFCFFCGSELSDLAEKQTINDTANNNSKKNTEDTSTVDANDSKQNHNLNSKNIFQKCSKNKKIIVIAGSVILGITILILIPIIINLYDTSSNNNDFYSGYNGSGLNDNEKHTSSSYLNNDYSEDDVLDSEDNSMDSNEINEIVVWIMVICTTMMIIMKKMTRKVMILCHPTEFGVLPHKNKAKHIILPMDYRIMDGMHL